jgi:biopolymer transport protein ExbD
MSARDNRTKDKPTEVQLPITPMLDMAFQLMFFFLATFNPQQQKEGQMDLSLPSKTEAAARDPKNVSPKAESHKEDVDIPSKITVTMRSHKEGRVRGKLSDLNVQTETDKKSVTGTEQQRQQQLAAILEAAKPKDAGAQKKPPTVRLEADKETLWQEVVKVMDVCYKAGFQVSFIKPLDLGENAP